MRGVHLTQKEIDAMVSLRATGHSLPEIRKLTGRGSSTVFKYVKDVAIFPEYLNELRTKQGGSRARSQRRWLEAEEAAKKLVPSLTGKEKLLLLAGLYWGEGAKRELSIINGDPQLIRVVSECLVGIGVRREDFKVTLRLFDDMDQRKILRFWIELLGIQRKQVLGVQVLTGKKSGKLPYGMCRLRVRKADLHFKLLMSVIDLMKSKV